MKFCYLVFLFSAFRLIFSLYLSSLSLMAVSQAFSLLSPVWWSSLVLTHLFMRASYGATPVTGCGVEQYPVSISWISMLPFLSLRWAICYVLLSSFMKLFASPLAHACSGVTRWWWNPSVLVSSANCLELNSGPLSLSTCLVVPWEANIVLSFSLLGWLESCRVGLREFRISCSLVYGY